MLTLTIAGVDRTAWLAHGYSLDIEKVLSTETMHLAILDLDSTAGAYRPVVGDDILLTRDDYSESGFELLFGGEIANVLDEPIIDDSGTVTRIRCRDRMALADQVFMPPQTYASAPVREVFTPIVETYLGPKGVTVISDPVGGVDIPELAIDDPVTTVRQTLDRITLQSGWPWRINGEKWAGIIEPGELPGPATLADDGQSVLTDPPLRWEKQILSQATRVFIQTAIPEAGPGPFEHTEEWTADGVQGVYPVHVLPTEIQCSTSASAIAGATGLSLTGLPLNASIRVGAQLRVDLHTQTYTVTAGVVTDGDGEVTVALDLTLERDVPEGHPVTFLRGAFVQLELDDVVTAMDGSPYVWDPIENAIVYPAGAFTVDTVVRYRTWAIHPTFVREWAPIAQQAIGWFDYEFIQDQRVTEEEGHRTLDGARSFAQAELARRLTPPKRVTCTTQIPGHYPLLLVPMDFPDRLVVGDYLVTETRIRHSNIDENGEILGVNRTQPLFYEMVLWEGDALGESWIQYFRGRNPAQGIRWGATPVPTLTPAVLQSKVLPHTNAWVTTITLDATPAVGSFLVMVVSRKGSSEMTPTLVSDNQAGGGNDWTRRLGTEPADPGSLDIWTAPVTVASGTFTITWDCGNVADREYTTSFCVELEDVDLDDPIMASTIANQSGATAQSADLPDTTVNTYVIGAITARSLSQTITAGAGWTTLYSGNVNNSVTQGMVVIGRPALVGSNDPTWTTTTAAFQVAGLTIKGAPDV